MVINFLRYTCKYYIACTLNTILLYVPRYMTDDSYYDDGKRKYALPSGKTNNRFPIKPAENHSSCYIVGYTADILIIRYHYYYMDFALLKSYNRMQCARSSLTKNNNIAKCAWLNCFYFLTRLK